MDNTAFRMFVLLNSGYCCTQIMLKIAMEAEEKENEDLVRAAKGLCMGIGGTQKTCGVLSGGIAILGLYAGKGNDTEYTKQEYPEMVNEYIKWFEAEFKSAECQDIIGVSSVTDYNTNQNYILKCGDILVKSYKKVQEILIDYGFEFGNRE